MDLGHSRSAESAVQSTAFTSLTANLVVALFVCGCDCTIQSVIQLARVSANAFDLRKNGDQPRAARER
jgi:hypothetical protein